jgi:DNA-binding NtrC family response regulator
MPQTKLNILAIDDDDSMLKTYKTVLNDLYNPILANNAAKAFEILRTEDVSLVLLDMQMPKMNGIEVLEKIKEDDSNLEVIMITAVPDIKTAVKALKLGAYDYLTKPFEIEALLAVMEKALEKKALTKENRYLKRTLEEKGPVIDLLGGTAVMKDIFGLINKVAATNSAVLITGESGTGKELAAHAIHKKSGRRNGPFVVINCAAIPENLIESELSGYERGAFTGALENKEGKFELADRGTLFLDEIGCMKTAMQSRLLRVLQDGFVERVGSKKSIHVDVRIISATNIDIEDAIKKGEFRQDLYYRLNVMRIHMPSLRQHRQDISLYLDHFIAKYNKRFNKKVKDLDKRSIELLEQYDWPGNVRELQNLVERAVALSDKETVSIEGMAFENSQENTTKKDLKAALADVEIRCIRNALAEAGGSQTKAAEILGIHRTTLIEKMKTLNLK